MTTRLLKIGVIGAGVFGNYHAAKCAAHPRHEFIGMFDTDAERLAVSAQRHGTQAYDNCNTLLSEVEAVIVACPAVHHGPVATVALRAGRHVLVEKPIASNLETAKTMVALAEDKDLVLQVGHQERFVARAIGLDRAPEKPISIHSTRFGPKSERGTDVSVTLDLMIHDLDMAMWLMQGRPTGVNGRSKSIYSNTPDIANVKLDFPDGRKAILAAGRAADARERITKIDYPSGHLIIDYVNKTFENTTAFDFDENFGDNELAKDSLGAATNAFTASILDGAPVAVPGHAGQNALEVALQIDEGMHV